MVEPRVRRIAVITRQYSALREGVMRAIFAPYVLAGGVAEYFWGFKGGWGLVLGLFNIFGWAALCVVAWVWVRKWMDRRFGRVHSKNPALEPCIIMFWLVGFHAMSFYDDHYAVSTGMPSARFLFIGAGALWCAVRLWPYSLHYFVVAGVSFAVAMPFAGLRGEAALDQWQIQAFGTTLLAWTAAGLIDLALLCKVLPPRPAEKGTTADA